MTEEDYLASEEPFERGETRISSEERYTQWQVLTSRIIVIGYESVRDAPRPVCAESVARAFSSDMQVRIVPSRARIRCRAYYYYRGRHDRLRPDRHREHGWRERPSALFEITSKSTRRRWTSGKNVAAYSGHFR